jgi:hypothetical protein
LGVEPDCHALRKISEQIKLFLKTLQGSVAYDGAMNDPWQHLGAFVLQFRAGTDIAADRFEGRVEHIASGRQARFHSLADLRTFLDRVLRSQWAEAAEAGLLFEDRQNDA